MKILVKFPTRGRKRKFIITIQNYMKYAKGDNYYMVTYDDNDREMDGIENELTHETIYYNKGVSTGKINACNRDIDRFPEDWDILILASDDMLVKQRGWDEVIIEAMKKYFPDTDGVLHFNDGYTGKELCTMSIIGRKYYDRFKYIYHKDYISLFCDNEFTEVAKKLKKYCYFREILFIHEHPAWTHGKLDRVYLENDKFYLQDQKTYERRKAKGYPT